jgi:hypothetical protein
MGKPEWKTWPYTSSTATYWILEDLKLKGRPSLFNCIQVERYIVPTLHLQLGLGNQILKNFFVCSCLLRRTYR